VWGEAVAIENLLGHGFKLLFLVMGVAILLTTEFGVLDATSRISTDIVKVNWLKDSELFSESRLYYLFLWGTIGLGIAILMVGDQRAGAFVLFKLTAALNGGVMFLYCALLLYMNRMRLPEAIRINGWRCAILAWAVCFFGLFAVWAVYDKLVPD